MGDAEEDTPGFDVYYGHGRVNAYNALSATTSLPSEKVLKQQMCSVYPNPSSGIFTVTFPSNTTQVKVFNSMGASVFTSNLTGQVSQLLQLDCSGIYFVQMITPNETFVEKVIVSK